MDLGNGWGLNETLLRKLRLLEYLADHSGRSLIPGLPEWAQQNGTKEHDDAISDLEDFNSRGWLRNFEQDNGGGASAELVGPGVAFVEDVRERRSNKQARNQATRDAILHWLHGAYLDGVRSPEDDAFFRTPFGLWYGQPFPAEDVQRATQWLDERGYVKGVHSAMGYVFRPRITTEGITVVESERSVNDPEPRGGGDTTNYISQKGQQNFAQQAGAGARQRAEVTFGVEQRAQVQTLADALERTIATTSEPVPAEIVDAPAELRAGEQTNDTGRIQAAVRAVQLAAAGSFGAAMGNDVYHPLHQLAQALGLLG